MKLYEWIDHKIFMWKIDYIMKMANANKAYMRSHYCRKGCHKLKQCKLMILDSKGKRKVEYLGCEYCNWKFFAHMRDKKKYLRMKEEQMRPVKEMLSARSTSSSGTKPRRLVGQAKKKSGDVSTRVTICTS